MKILPNTVLNPIRHIVWCFSLSLIMNPIFISLRIDLCFYLYVG